jgi:hypothetical protein
MSEIGPVTARRFKFVGCEIIHREACFVAATVPHLVELEFLRQGLHDLQTTDMRSQIQVAVDAVDADQGYEAILLGYGRCNNGLLDVTARDLPLVIPRAHDCITFFFGSRDKYLEWFKAHPGTYYMTTGWAERNSTSGDPLVKQTGVMAALGLSDSFAEMVEKYGKDNADYILETLGDWRDHYSNMLYLEMGVANEAELMERARRTAEERSWSFEVRKGSLALLEKLFLGLWDDDFVVVQPGQCLSAQNDGEGVFEATVPRSS